ncbi:hypothetical protein QBC39DRAFT_261131 [Podospora conica]|nr:hypothetical protein QBC39DRAFT_261131 [Schizothecium conicum]
MRNTQEEYVGGHYDALSPIGISFRGSNGSLGKANVSQENLLFAKSYLNRHFNVECFNVHGVFAELACSEVPKGRLPSFVGGMVAIWQRVDEPTFWPWIGEGGESEEKDTSEEYAAVVASFRETDGEPTDAALIKLADYFTDCQAITFIHPIAVIEFPLTDIEAFRDRLETLPYSIGYFPYVLRYHNGPLPNTPGRKRAQKPKPEPAEHERIADETDYVKLDGKFYPGAMISSVNENDKIYASASAGILVQRGTEIRLTCSWHCWEEQWKKYQKEFDQDSGETRRIFSVRQGRSGEDSGIDVGRVVRRVGETDIALAKLKPGVLFENRLMEADATAKKLVHSSRVVDYEQFLVDSFATGVQRFISVGSRVAFDRGDQDRLVAPNGDKSLLLPIDVTYIAGKQHVCASGEAVLTRRPFVWERACGSVLLRSKGPPLAGENPFSTDGSALDRGEVVAMFRYADLTDKYTHSASEHLIYAESFDPLIKEGWQVVPLPGKEAEANLGEVFFHTT